MDQLEFPPLPQSPESAWEYSMRRQMQEILPHVYLGPYSAANKSQLDSLKAVGITHIVCISHTQERRFVRPNFPEQFKYLELDIEDFPTINIVQHFPKVKVFVDECLQSNGKVLIHGNAGISRSGAIVIAYVMEKYGCCYEKAFGMVRDKRSCVNPNDGFVNQLKEYEMIFKARLQIEAMPSTSATNGVLKRKLEDDDDEADVMDC